MKTLILLLLLFSLTLYASATDSDEYDHCNCDDEEALFSIHTILVGQKVSDFFIAIAYFSIPIELLYFVSRSNVPFKLLFLQFIAFIVLCGMTHLLNAYSYHSHPSFQLLLSLTVAKFLTALVSCATALTLPPLIPLLLRIKVREIFLRQNVMELGQEVGIMKKQKEASWHVRMLTREIRKSLDKHTILYTTLVELSKALDLHNCAVWMPNDDRREMYLTHELKSDSVKSFHHNSIPVIDPDVLEIRKTKGVRILRPESKLGAASSGGGSTEELGAVAAIRMPMLHVSNFKGGTPELVDTCYAILVLVLPGSNSRVWTAPEMEIVEVVADQVAVALSHASVLEESHLMREKLEEQNRALQQSQKNAMMASQARKSFQTVMSHGLRRPMHSVVGMLSLFQEGNMRPEQKIIGDTMLKVGNVLSSLVNDVMDISENKKGGLQLEMKPFLLHSMLREAACIAKCLCVSQGFGFQIDVEKSLPEKVLGDEARTFQVIMHIIGYLLNTRDRGNLVFRVFFTSEGGDKDDKKFGVWRSSSPVEYVDIKFDFQITGSSQSDEPISTKQQIGRRLNHNSESKEGLSFNMCRRLVQIMQGNIWILPNSQGLVQGVSLLLKFQIGPSLERYMFAPKDYSNSLFGGLKILLADDDGLNRIVTKKLLERLGCLVTAVSSGFECLGAISGSGGNSFKIIMLDIHMPEMDGFEVAARIRKFNGPNWPLIIALIANAEEQVKDRCMLAGMNGVIRKPILLHQIADELRSVLLRAEKRDWRMKSESSEAAEYFSKDFEWEELRSEVESNPSLRHHFESSSSHSSTQSPESDVHAWKQFHTRHSSGKFFKERRYLLKEFPQLLPSPSNSKLLEVGCGNGSTILPILRANKDIVVYACDCSDETLDKAKEIINENSNAVDLFMNRFHTFCCDFSTTGFPNWLACNPCRDKFLQQQSCLSDVKEDNGKDSYSLQELDCCVGGVDFVTLIFTLSAVPLERMPRSIKECFTVLKPGGMVLFRDYGLYDMTMLRFEPDKRVGFREYMRSDGTRSYFFCLNTVRDLFLGAGFIELELDYCCVKSVNRQKGKSMRRVWVHGKFQKPALN